MIHPQDRVKVSYHARQRMIERMGRTNLKEKERWVVRNVRRAVQDGAVSKTAPGWTGNRWPLATDTMGWVVAKGGNQPTAILIDQKESGSAVVVTVVTLGDE